MAVTFIVLFLAQQFNLRRRARGKESVDELL